MNYFKLYNSCKVVKGACNCMIYDLDRVGNSNLIPDSLYIILTEFSERSIKEIKLIYENKFDIEIDEYFSFLLENEYIFMCTKTELSNFPTLDFKWNTPNKLTNAILDYDGTVPITDYYNFVKELSSLNCKAIEIRSFIGLTLKDLEKFLNLFELTSIQSIELVSKFVFMLEDKILISIQKRHPRLNKISLYNAPIDDNNLHINYYQKKLHITSDCGEINPDYFSIEIDTFSEAQSCNTCLNKKISVDGKGLIKVCPSMKVSYGSINETSLVDVINNSKIKELWSIKKDDVEICKDCEYRYCCTDCRVFTDNPNYKYSRPSKCRYNPYIGLWENEEGYIEVNKWLKQNKR